MPYASKAQQGLFHSPNSPVSAKEVAKFDADSKGQKGLPSHAHAKSQASSKAKSKPKGARASALRAQVLRQADNGEA